MGLDAQIFSLKSGFVHGYQHSAIVIKETVKIRPKYLLRRFLCESNEIIYIKVLFKIKDIL